MNGPVFSLYKKDSGRSDCCKHLNRNYHDIAIWIEE